MAPGAAATAKLFLSRMVRGKSDALPAALERVSASVERRWSKHVADFLDSDLPVHFCGRLDQCPPPFGGCFRDLAFIAPGGHRFRGRLPPGILEGPQRCSPSGRFSANYRLVRIFCGGYPLADLVCGPLLCPGNALRRMPNQC